MRYQLILPIPDGDDYPNNVCHYATLALSRTCVHLANLHDVPVIPVAVPHCARAARL